MHVVDEPNLNEWSKDQRDYNGTYYAVLELKPTTTKSVAKVDKIQQGGLIGLRCPATTALIPPSTIPVVKPSPSPPHPTRPPEILGLHRSQYRYLRPTIPRARLNFAAGKQGVIIVSGDDERLHQTGFIGWPKFLEYFGKNPSAFVTAP